MLVTTTMISTIMLPMTMVMTMTEPMSYIMVTSNLVATMKTDIKILLLATTTVHPNIAPMLLLLLKNYSEKRALELHKSSNHGGSNVPSDDNPLPPNPPPPNGGWPSGRQAVGIKNTTS